MLARFEGELLDGAVFELSPYINGPAPDYLTVSVEVSARRDEGGTFEYSLMKLSAEPDAADGVSAIYLCPVFPRDAPIQP
jgi:hypothetical protein